MVAFELSTPPFAPPTQMYCRNIPGRPTDTLEPSPAFPAAVSKVGGTVVVDVDTVVLATVVDTHCIWFNAQYFPQPPHAGLELLVALHCVEHEPGHVYPGWLVSQVLNELQL